MGRTQRSLVCLQCKSKVGSELRLGTPQAARSNLLNPILDVLRELRKCLEPLQD